jgi:hypothetical protein
MLRREPASRHPGWIDFRSEVSVAYREPSLALRLLVLAAIAAAYFLRPISAGWVGLFTIFTSCVVMPLRPVVVVTQSSDLAA